MGVFYFQNIFYICKMYEDIEIYVKMLEKRFPRHSFHLSISGYILYVYGEEENDMRSYCDEFSRCMNVPIKRITFIQMSPWV